MAATPDQTTGMQTTDMTVRMLGIAKRFGTVTALEHVDFDVPAGCVTALLGDNGAGKSTLIKILTGVYPPSGGTIHFEGREVSISSPRDARALGIETVYQDLALVPLMSVARNFFLGRELTGMFKLPGPAPDGGADAAGAGRAWHREVLRGGQPLGVRAGRQAVGW